ncbi:MAG: AAA family ATPase [Bauldia litoralis]
MNAGTDSSNGRAEAQGAVAELMLDPATHDGAETERIDTHISTVFLAGDHVFKMKRAVHFGYLDFSSLEERRQACEAEVRINRITAPDIYITVVPVTRGADGVLALDGGGEVVEWLVKMRRFDQDMLFDRLAQAGKLGAGEARGLADTIFEFHDRVPPADADGGAIVERVIRGNAAEMAAQSVLEPDLVGRLEEESLAWLERVRPMLDDRSRSGWVRRCHGDLHLRNIVLLDGSPTLFDAIEFSEELATIDVLYDLAFLLMDLEHRALNETANAVMNRYLMRAGDYSGLAALPLFLSLRAAIRAHTTAAASGGGEQADEARAYLELALRFLAPAPACLVAIGGLSGTGKSTVAAHLARRLGRQPGALVLRSDGIRKRLQGVAPETALGAEAYTHDVTREVYSTIAVEAGTALDAGFSAVADAVFGRPDERAAIQAEAQARGLPFVGVWLEAPAELLADRIAGRADDASDADRAVMEQQRARIAPPDDWRRLDATADAADLAVEIRRLTGDA